MANKKLKTMAFPGLPDTYTIPQVPDGAAGHLAALDGSGNLLDSGRKPADFGSARAVEILYKLAKGQLFDSQTDSAAAYSKTVPSGAKAAEIASIGGKTVVWNQQIYNGNFGISSPIGWASSGTLGPGVVEDGALVVTVDKPASEFPLNGISQSTQSQSINVVGGHVYAVHFEYFTPRTKTLRVRTINGNTYSGGFSKDFTTTPNAWLVETFIVTAQSAGTRIGFPTFGGDPYEEGDVVKLRNVWMVDLTVAVGAVNEPTALDDPRIAVIEAYAAEHPEYNAGELLSADLTSVVSKYKTVSWNQQIYNGNFAITETPIGWTASGGNTTEISNGEIQMTVATPDAEFPQNGIIQSTLSYPHPAIITGHKYLVNLEYLNPRGKILRVRTLNGNSYTGGFLKDFSVTAGEWLYGRFISAAASSDGTRIGFPTFGGDPYEVGDVVKLRNVWMVDLTAMFGEGAEPTETTDERVAAIAAYVGENPLYNAAQTIGQTTVNDQVVFVTDPVIDLIEIPSAVRALEGYGQSAVGGNGNALNLSAGTFTEIGHYVDGVWTSLEEPVVTDVSAMIPGNMLTVEAGGSLTFVQAETAFPVPNSVDYLIKLSEANV